MSAIPAAFPEPSLRAQALLEAEWLAGPSASRTSSEGAPHERRQTFLFARPEGGYTVLSVATPMDAAERPNGPNVTEVASFRTLHRALGEMAQSKVQWVPWGAKMLERVAVAAPEVALLRVSGRPEMLDRLMGDVSEVMPHGDSVRFRASCVFDRLRSAASVLDALEVAAGEPEIAVRGALLRPEVVVEEGPLASVGRPALAILIAEKESSVYMRASGLPSRWVVRAEEIDGPHGDAIWQVIEVAGRVRDAAGRTESAGLSGWSTLTPAEYADPAVEAARAVLRIAAVERESTGHSLLRARAVRLALQDAPLSSKAHQAAADIFREQTYRYPRMVREPLHNERLGWEALATHHEGLAHRLQVRELAQEAFLADLRGG